MKTSLNLSLCAALWWGVAVCCAPAEPATRSRQRPNILFILADDLGWMDVSCYGSQFCETPNLDRLARTGLRFTQAYTAGAVCSPTRASIQTGKYPARLGITDWIPGQRPSGMKLIEPKLVTALPLSEVTIAEALQAGGYQTFYAGKWHLGENESRPNQQGYEVHVGDDELGDHRTDWRVGRRIVEAAARFLDERDASRPFFAFLGFHEPHTPILEYPDHIDRFRQKTAKLDALGKQTLREHDGQTRARQDNATYGSEVAGLDDCIGLLLRALDDRKLADDTIVIFFSDNGGLATTKAGGPTCNAPLRSGKGWLYEGGIRVPCIVRAPGITRPGTTSDAMIFSTDFYPTLLELAGLPPRSEQHQDGLSLMSPLRGRAGARRTLYWHYPHYHGSTWSPGAAIRDGDWKLIEFYHYDKAELYNLKNDPGEAIDLSATNPAKSRELLEKLRAWQKSVNAQMPKANPDAAEAGSATDDKERATNQPGAR